MNVLGRKQLEWCAKVAGFDLLKTHDPSLDRKRSYVFLEALSHKMSRVNIEIVDGRVRLWYARHYATGADIMEAVNNLVWELCPDDDPDPHLTELMVNTLAPGQYPTWEDRVAAAVINSNAQAAELSAHIDMS